MKKNTFLVEVGTEDLPSKYLLNLIKYFTNQINQRLNISNIIYEKLNWFATSKRLAVQVININYKKNKINVISEKQIKDKNINKNNKVIINNLLYKIVYDSINRLNIFETMRWSDKNIKFIRPIHTITLLLNNKIISGCMLGININRIIYGHYFIGQKKIYLDHALNYTEVLLKKGKVIADFNIRKNKIYHDIKLAAQKINSMVYFSKKILDEVTSSVEWPIILVAKFKDEFLNMPKEIIIHIIETNKKYFPTYNLTGQLLSYFIFVVNIDSKDSKKIILGNEQVLNSQLSDAKFFFDNDRKKNLESYLPLLKKVIFQKKLGTMLDKSKRIQSLSVLISKHIDVNIEYVKRASILCKCDLMTNIVFEFNDMKGIIGMHYAYLDGEKNDIAIAIKEHYLPKFSGDLLPNTIISCILSIADKIDTLVGFFSIHEYPKKNKDPFALRRTSISIINVIIKKRISINLKLLIIKSLELYNIIDNKNIINKIMYFIRCRLNIWYQEQGYHCNIIKSVIYLNDNDLTKLDFKICTINELYNSNKLDTLIKINKRMKNILIKSNIQINGELNYNFLCNLIEINLINKFKISQNKILLMNKLNKYKEALEELNSLSTSIEIFFEKITIIDDNLNIRMNRLILISKIYKLFLQVADFSVL